MLAELFVNRTLPGKGCQCHRLFHIHVHGTSVQDLSCFAWWGGVGVGGLFFFLFLFLNLTKEARSLGQQFFTLVWEWEWMKASSWKRCHNCLKLKLCEVSTLCTQLKYFFSLSYNTHFPEKMHLNLAFRPSSTIRLGSECHCSTVGSFVGVPVRWKCYSLITTSLFEHHLHFFYAVLLNCKWFQLFFQI